MRVQASDSFYENPEGCKECHRALPKDYKDELCPACKERLLFSKVKDYIRANDVTEFDVAKHFEIPLFKVKGWIREGRIEYKDLQIPSLKNLRCQKCGKPISFGSQCTDCLRQSNVSGNAALNLDNLDERIRFLQK